MFLSNSTDIKTQIKKFALAQGFSKVGFSPCNPVAEELERIKLWFSDGFAGPLDYLSPERFFGHYNMFPNAKTAFAVFLPYARPNAIPGKAFGSLKLSRYLWGPDYHRIVKSRLFTILEFLKKIVPGTEGCICVDSSPIMERQLATQAGLGWQGKNTLLIAGKQGSWGFLGILLLDIELEPDLPFEGNRCGTCMRCVDACPTGALKPFRLDCRRCLTTWNIERENNSEKEIHLAISNTGWVAGCDICQEVCPWNSNPEWGDPNIWGGVSELHTKPATDLQITSSRWRKITEGTALRRIRHRHWISNIDIALNYGNPDQNGD